MKLFQRHPIKPVRQSLKPWLTDWVWNSINLIPTLIFLGFWRPVELVIIRGDITEYEHKKTFTVHKKNSSS